MNDSELDRIAADLYTRPPGEFVAARDDQVRLAKEQGNPELASALSKLRRPTLSAWLVNRIVRERPELVDQIAELAKAFHEGELTAVRLRELSEQRQRLIGDLARAAESLQGSVSAQAVREVESTFAAALAEPEIPTDVRLARLDRPLSYAGFGGPVSLVPPQPESETRPESEAPPDPVAAQREAERRAARKEAAERERAEAERALHAAEERLARAEHDVRKAKERLDRAQREARG